MTDYARFNYHNINKRKKTTTKEEKVAPKVLCGKMRIVGPKPLKK